MDSGDADLVVILDINSDMGKEVDNLVQDAERVLLITDRADCRDFKMVEKSEEGVPKVMVGNNQIEVINIPESA